MLIRPGLAAQLDSSLSPKTKETVLLNLQASPSAVAILPDEALAPMPSHVGEEREAAGSTLAKPSGRDGDAEGDDRVSPVAEAVRSRLSLCA
jgi:hypothetical protein